MKTEEEKYNHIITYYLNFVSLFCDLKDN